AIQPPFVDRASLAGWICWRLSGLAIFAGYMSGSALLFGGGVVLLLAAFGSVAAVAQAARDPLARRQTRLLNGVLGGGLLVLVLTLAFGALGVLFLGVAAALSSSTMAILAAKLVAFLATGAAGAITASGWTPDDWSPRRRAVHTVERAPEEVSENVAAPS
ncbi:MAG: hypothetical protein ACREID_04580, partial [Planctomycetota bacterium]